MMLTEGNWDQLEADRHARGTSAVPTRDPHRESSSQSVTRTAPDCRGSISTAGLGQYLLSPENVAEAIGGSFPDE